MLADFIAGTQSEANSESSYASITTTEPYEEESWWLYTDGASSSEDSRARIRLVSPQGEEFTYALKFEFDTTNNEAEYEALLAGLRLAHIMKIKNIQTFVDAQLVA